MRLTPILMATVTLLTVCQAQDVPACTTETTRGFYVLACNGFMSPAANAPQVPFNIMGSATADYAGNFTGTATAVLAGVAMSQTVTTSSNTMNSDCTGKIVYAQKINGQLAGQTNLIYQVLDGGNEIRGMSVDAGVNLSCSLRRIHK
jgi:hypothetical protein